MKLVRDSQRGPQNIAQSFLDSVRHIYPNGARDIYEFAAEAHTNKLADRIEAALREFAAVPANSSN